MTREYQDSERAARALDDQDPLAAKRELFYIPPTPTGEPVVYLCGNSLGLEPKGVEARIQQELEDWKRLAVHAHFHGANPWFSYHEMFRESGARLVGALPSEVVMMNSLTVNLHLMMVSFYRPSSERYKILIEECAFPSDSYAVRTQLRHHGYDPADGLVVARSREGETCLRTEDLVALIEREGKSIALVMLSGVQYFTGQLFEIPRIVSAARRQGCRVGIDLAHAAGNVPLELHDWNVDFAAWCSYKYLNAGPGAVAGCFVHERWGNDLDVPRFAGWWGNDPEERFLMHLRPEFTPRRGADGWQLSNPPVLALAPLRESLDIFDAAGMDALRHKSLRLTGYLEWLVDRIEGDRYEIITPRDPAQRGSQLSILVHRGARELIGELEREGVVCDFREPNVIRAAPVPLYNTFLDVWKFARVLGARGGSNRGG